MDDSTDGSGAAQLLIDLLAEPQFEINEQASAADPAQGVVNMTRRVVSICACTSHNLTL